MAIIKWQSIVNAILDATPPRGKDKYSLEMIKVKTGINISTLSRLSTQPKRRLEYNQGVKLMAMYNDLKETGKI